MWKNIKEWPIQGDIKTKLGLGKLPLFRVRKRNLVNEANARRRELGGRVHEMTRKNTLTEESMRAAHIKKRNTDLRRV